VASFGPDAIVDDYRDLRAAIRKFADTPVNT
jgi:hypothetical protein